MLLPPVTPCITHYKITSKENCPSKETPCITHYKITSKENCTSKELNNRLPFKPLNMKLALVALLVAAHVASANGFGYDDYDQTLPHCNSYSEGFLGRLMKQNAACSCNDGERKVDSGRRSWIKSKTVQVFENVLVSFQTFAHGDIYVKSGNLGLYFVCRNHRQALDLIIRDYDPSPEEGEKLADHLVNVLAKGSKPHMHRVFKS
jgi:hypothetical protein